MNESRTPKIVVGVALAALYATGLAYVTVRGTQDKVVAQTPIAAEPILPPAVGSTSADALASVAEQPAVVAAAAASIPGAAVSKTPAASSTRGASAEAPLRDHVPMIAGVATVSRTEEIDFGESNPTSEGADARNTPANSAADTQSVQAESESSGSATQRISDAQSQVAAVTPASASDATE